MSQTNWNSVIKQFQNLTVLIVGDAMIDAYMWGSIQRKSPEAAVPVVDIERHENRLGGAANVAKNIKSLGATPLLCAVIGTDDKGFFSLMKKQGLNTEGLLQEDRKTTVKTRIISEQQHQLRVDEEDTHPISNEKAFIENTAQLMIQADVVIFQDYNKGVLTESVISALISAAKEQGIPTVADPKKDNYWKFIGVDLFKPNLKELNEGANSQLDGSDLSLLSAAVSQQREQLEAKQLLLTLSEKGVFLQGEQDFYYPTFDRNIIDVSGAGDSVIATAALALTCGLSPQALAQLANLAGGLVCEEVGVVPIHKEELLAEANRLI